MKSSSFGHFFLTFILVALHSSSGISQTKSSGNEERLALLPFETKGFSIEEAVRLMQSFAGGLGESKRFDVMPEMVLRNNLEQAGLSKIDSCNTRPCLAQLGNVLNVEKIVHVQAERWEQRFVMHIRLIRSSDAALLYDERIDYSGEISTLTATIAPEQGRKLAAAFLDKKPNWWLIAGVVLVGVGLIYWLFRSFGTKDSSVPQENQPVGPTQ
jgi:hypothetical protein